MRLIAAAVAAVLTLSACAGESADARGVSAVATVFPLAWIAQEIAPDADLTFLGQRGQEPHDLELSPVDRAAIEQADVVVYLGDIGFQPQVEEAVPAAAGEVVGVADIVPADLLRAGAAHAHEEGEDEAEDDAEGSVDPHVWFDPALMAIVAERTGQAFAAADPQRGDEYVANAAAVAEQLTALDAEIGTLLSDCARDEAIVSHEAYAYLLEPRGLAQHGIAGVDPEGGVTPQALAELSGEIEAQGIRFVLAEPVEGRADAEALAAETGVELLEIDPLEVVTDEQFARGYPDLLREQAERFAQALECR